MSRLLHCHKLVLKASHAERGGVLNGVEAVLGLEQVGERLASLRGLNQVEARLVQRDGVGRGEDADVGDDGLGVGAAVVALGGQLEEEVQVHDAASEVVDDGLRRLRVRLKESVLVPVGVARARRPAGMDEPLSRRVRHADGQVLHDSADSRHRVPLEVREDKERVVVLQVRADHVVRKDTPALHRKAHLALLVDDVNGRDFGEAVLLGDFPADFHRVAHAGGVDVRRPELFHERRGKLRLDVQVAARLAHALLHGDPPRQRLAQPLVQGERALRGHLAREVDDRLSRRLREQRG